MPTSLVCTGTATPTTSSATTCSCPAGGTRLKVRPPARLLALCLPLLAAAWLPSCRNLLPARTAEPAAAVKARPEQLFQAAQAGDLDLVRQLLAENPGLVEAEDGSGWNALSHAAWNGHKRLHDFLLDKGAEGTLFSEAACGPFRGFLQRLDANPLGLAARDTAEKATPLIWAVRGRNLTGCEVLISRGADLQARDREGNTALHHAVDLEARELCELLLQYGADTQAANKLGRTALHLASARGPFDIALLLLDRGASLRAADAEGNSPLHLAAARGDLELCEYYVALGAPAGLKNQRGQTALQLAEQAGHRQVVQLLEGRSGR